MNFFACSAHFCQKKKFSDPSTNVTWEKATSKNNTINLRIRPNPEQSDVFFDDVYEFWKSLEIYDYSVITGKRKPKPNPDTGASYSVYSVTLMQICSLISLQILLYNLLTRWQTFSF